MEEIIYKVKAREELKKGIDAVANAVKVTYGPKGRNVVIFKGDSPHSTKDGVTVAKNINLSGPRRIGAEMIKQAAEKTATIAGDSTTLTTIMTQAFVNGGDKALRANANPVHLKKGMELALKDVVTQIKKQSKKVSSDKELKSIATTSANNDPIIGGLIADAYKEVTMHGLVNAEVDPYSSTITMTVDKGLQFNKGYYTANFIEDRENMQTVMENASILVLDQKVNSFSDIKFVVSEFARTKEKLLIVADDFAPEVVSTLELNFIRKGLRVIPIKAPGFGEHKMNYLDDIKLLTGSKGDELGKADKVIVNQHSTTIIDGKGIQKDIEAKVALIKDNLKANTFTEQKELERIARLTGGIATINVGANSEIEAKEIKDRVDDAIAAVRAAIKEGVVDGGGYTFYKINKQAFKAPLDKEYSIGYKIVIDALIEPLRQICRNAGVEYNTVANNIDTLKKGYNALTDEFVNLKKANVIDPTMALRVSLENAISIATTYITTECVIFEDN